MFCVFLLLGQTYNYFMNNKNKYYGIHINCVNAKNVYQVNYKYRLRNIKYSITYGVYYLTCFACIVSCIMLAYNLAR